LDGIVIMFHDPGMLHYFTSSFAISLFDRVCPTDLERTTGSKGHYQSTYTHVRG